MAIQLGDEDLRRAFDAGTLQKGASILKRGGVRRIELSADGSRISGSVLGSRPKPYSQTITLSTAADGRLRIRGYCSCPVGVNCKHLAAVLLEHLAFGGADEDEILTRHKPNALSTQGTRKAALAEPPEPAASLSAHASRWLERLGSINAAKTQSATGSNQRVLVYVLNHENTSPADGVPCVRIRPISARLRKDGSLTDGKFYNPENILRTKEQRARFLTEADLEMLRGLLWLMRMGTAPGSQDIVLGSDAASWRIFEGLLQSGTIALRRLWTV